ncbi:hypothetical protein LUZ60_004040 [Juncus effusus]|nr:hypothetical protein LUZ60_004040 [Juncus effusus]
MSSLCPFAKTSISPGATCPIKHNNKNNNNNTKEEEHQNDNNKNENNNKNNSATISPKCPFGYDSETFKLGPLSCMICHALLFNTSKCVPCAHKFCKVCISRFNDCPLCGADIESTEPETDLQATVDRFINGHARIKRIETDDLNNINNNKEEVIIEGKKSQNVIYEDVSMERGAFLVQQAMRAFKAGNIESAKSRLILCKEDLTLQLKESKTTEDSHDLNSQLGAVLGMLGDCSRAMGDAESAIGHYEESVDFLVKLPSKDLEVVHTLSVSLNKIGDLKYYNGDLESARNYYAKSLEVRRQAVKEHSDASSQVVDLATSLAKVADVDKNLGEEKKAIDGFKEAIECLQSLKLDSIEPAIQQKRKSVLAFLQNQLAGNESQVSSSPV